MDGEGGEGGREGERRKRLERGNSWRKCSTSDSQQKHMHKQLHYTYTSTCTCTYRIARNIGRELHVYLADWRISCHAANIKSANIAPTTQRRRGDIPREPITAKFISSNCNFLPFSSNLPNIIPANISGYTVVYTSDQRYLHACTCTCSYPSVIVVIVMVAVVYMYMYM